MFSNYLGSKTLNVLQKWLFFTATMATVFSPGTVTASTATGRTLAWSIPCAALVSFTVADYLSERSFNPDIRLSGYFASLFSSRSETKERKNSTKQRSVTKRRQILKALVFISSIALVTGGCYAILSDRTDERKLINLQNNLDTANINMRNAQEEFENTKNEAIKFDKECHKLEADLRKSQNKYRNLNLEMATLREKARKQATTQSAAEAKRLFEAERKFETERANYAALKLKISRMQCGAARRTEKVKEFEALKKKLRAKPGYTQCVDCEKEQELLDEAKRENTILRDFRHNLEREKSDLQRQCRDLQRDIDNRPSQSDGEGVSDIANLLRRGINNGNVQRKWALAAFHPDKYAYKDKKLAAEVHKSVLNNAPPSAGLDQAFRDAQPQQRANPFDNPFGRTFGFGRRGDPFDSFFRSF